MQFKDANELREIWEKKGNPVCKHLSLEKEYYLSMDTGDYICTTCGKVFPPDEYAKFTKQ
jgi:hypothetical protein